MVKKLIIVRGPSCVGKSIVSKELSRELKKKCKKLALIPVDLSISKLVIKLDKFDEKFSKLKQKNTEDLVNNFLSNNYDVVVEGLFCKTSNGKYYLDKMLSIGRENKAKISVIELHASFETIKQRIKKRSKENPKHDNNLKNSKRRYDSFMKYPYKKAIKIDTENKSIKSIVKEIKGKI